MADVFSSQKNSKKRRHSYSVSRGGAAPSSISVSGISSLKRRPTRWSQSDAISDTLQEDNSESSRKRSRSFFGYFKKSKTLKSIRRNSAGASVGSLEREAGYSPSAVPIFEQEQEDEYIRVVMTIIHPQINYKTLPITPATTVHEVIATLVNKFAITSDDKQPDAFYLTEVRESEQGSYSRLLEDNDRVYDIQKKWVDGKKCYFELCRKKICVQPQEDSFTSSPIKAMVLSPSQDSFFSQECSSPVSLSEFIFPTAHAYDSGEPKNSDKSTPTVLPPARTIHPPLSPSDTSAASSVELVEFQEHTSGFFSDQMTTQQDIAVGDALATSTAEQRSQRQSDDFENRNGTRSDHESYTKRSSSLDQVVQQSIREQVHSEILQEKEESCRREKYDSIPQTRDAIQDGSPKQKHRLLLKTLVCSPVNPKEKKYPEFIFTSSDKEGSRLTFDQDQHSTRDPPLIKHSAPVNRQCRTSRTMSDVKFETTLTIYPEFQTTASLFPSYARRNAHYDTEMNIVETLSNVLETKIFHEKGSKTKVQKGISDKTHLGSQHTFGENNPFLIDTESDTFSPMQIQTATSAPNGPQRNRIVSETTCDAPKPKFRRPHTFHYVMGTHNHSGSEKLPSSDRDEQIYRAGMAVRHLQGSLYKQHRTYSSSTTCISSEIQSDLDALISQRQLSQQLEMERLQHTQSHNNLALPQLQLPQLQQGVSSSELLTHRFSFPNIRSLTHNTRHYRQSSDESYTDTAKYYQPHIPETYKSLEMVNQGRQGEISEVLYTFPRNQRPITVLVRSKSSLTLQTHQYQLQSKNSRSKSSTDLTRFHDSSCSETLEHQRRRDRPTSAPQHHRQGRLAGLMYSLQHKADKQWWTEL